MYKFLTQWLPLIIIVILITIFLLFMWAGTGNEKRKYDNESKRDSNYQTDYSRLIQIYEFLSRFPLTSKSTNQLMDIISGLSMYNNLEQRVETARLAGMSYLICLAISTATIVLTDGNLIICISALVLALAFRRDFVNKRLQKKRLSFWLDLQKTMSSLQQEYERTMSITTAFNMCQAEDTTKYMIANIENILKSSDPEGALTHFYNNNPFHICIRLANLCYNTFKYSAKYIEKEGTDSFIDGLDSLLFDIQTEIDLAIEEKRKFYKVEKLPLVGLLFAFIAPWYLQSRFYGLRYYFNDGFGFISSIFSMLIIVGSYIIATRLNDKDKSQEDVTAWELKRFEDVDYSNKWRNRAGDSRYRSFELLIEQSLSYLTPPMIMFRKTIYGLSGLVISICMILGYLYIERQSLLTNFETIPEAVMTELETNYEDYNFVIKKVYDDENLKTTEDIKVSLYTAGWNLTDAEIEVMSNQIMNNKDRMNSLGFSPIHLFIAFIVMIIFYNIPELLLKRRAKLVRQEAKIEVLLLQSVVCQLMYTPLKLNDYLMFFSSISRLYAGEHLRCYIEHFNNPQYLKDQAYKMFDNDYYVLMEQLYTLYNSSTPPQIFRTTASKRRYLAQKNLESRREALSVNYSWLSALLNAALLSPVILQILLPMATFVSEALKQYSTMMPQ